MDSIILRQFQLEDYERVVEVWLQAGLFIRPGDDKASISRKLERDPELFLVATDGDAIVGTVIGAYDGRRGHLYHLAVPPVYQGRGIGRLLVGEVAKRLAALDCPRLNLSVDADNFAAIGFYEKLGFTGQHRLMGKDL